MILGMLIAFIFLITITAICIAGSIMMIIYEDEGGPRLIGGILLILSIVATLLIIEMFFDIGLLDALDNFMRIEI